MACEEKTYQKVNEKAMGEIRATLTGYGLRMPETNEGTVEGKALGVEAVYRWDPQAQTFWLRIDSKPMFIPCNFIYGRLEQVINDAQA